MIVIAMAQHRGVERAHAQRPQRGHNGTFAGIESFGDGRPHVV